MADIDIVTLDPDNAGEKGCYCLKNRKQKGYDNKLSWMKKRFDEGLKVKILSSEETGQIGFIEYIPGENCWRGFSDPDYLFIHCIYIARKSERNQFNGELLINLCKDDAKIQGKKGVAVITSRKAMLAESNVFLKNGFVVAESHPSGYDLMVCQFSEGPMPGLVKNDIPEKYSRGLHLLFAGQCPYFLKSVEAIEKAAADFGLTLNAIEMRSAAEAQNAPSLYGVFNLIHDGELIAEHYISEKRFTNIMKSRLSSAS